MTREIQDQAVSKELKMDKEGAITEQRSPLRQFKDRFQGYIESGLLTNLENIADLAPDFLLSEPRYHFASCGNIGRNYRQNLRKLANYAREFWREHQPGSLQQVKKEDEPIAGMFLVILAAHQATSSDGAQKARERAKKIGVSCEEDRRLDYFQQQYVRLTHHFSRSKVGVSSFQDRVADLERKMIEGLKKA